jgi:hypothetical protein
MPAHETDARAMLHVLHHIPGRLRVRLPGEARAEGLVEAVTAVPGVASAAWSPRTRGLLVRYERERADPAAIVAAIAAHTDVEVAPPAPRAATVPTLAGAATSLFGEIDGRVLRATRGAVGLGVLIPAALTLWAAREILRGRTAPLAWSSALWYAHGIFRDYTLPAHED